MFTPNLGEMIQVDYCNILQVGWFNHQLEKVDVAKNQMVNYQTSDTFEEIWIAVNIPPYPIISCGSTL